MDEGDMFTWSAPPGKSMFFVNNELLGAHNHELIRYALTLPVGSYICTLQRLPLHRFKRGVEGDGLGVCFTETTRTIRYEEMAERNLDAVLAALKDANIPSGKIYDAADIAADPHYQARDMLLASQLDDGTAVTLPGIVPKLTATPGRVHSRSPTLGQHTDAVLDGIGIDAPTREAWRARGLI